MKDDIPDGVVVASNGAWRDAETGRYVAGGQPDNMITSENATDYHRLREQKKIEGILAANGSLAEAAGSPSAAWGKVARAMYDTSLDPKSRIAAVQAARLLGDMAGFLSSGGNGADPVAPGAMRLELGAGVAEDIFDYISQHRDREDTNR